MSSVDSTALASLGLGIDTSATSNSKMGNQELGQDDFLRLMTAQLQAQDPLKPLDNAEFLSQIAQFSTVSGVQGMQESMTSLISALQSSQMLQATSLVGHDVLVSGSQGYLSDGGQLQGAVDVSSSGQVQVDIVDAGGQVVRTLNLGQQAAGQVNFSWDGTTAAGETASPGTYSVRARLLQPTGAQQALSTSVAARVVSVVPGDNGLMLEFDGLPPVALTDVQQFM